MLPNINDKFQSLSPRYVPIKGIASITSPLAFLRLPRHLNLKLFLFRLHALQSIEDSELAGLGQHDLGVTVSQKRVSRKNDINFSRSFFYLCLHL